MVQHTARSSTTWICTAGSTTRLVRLPALPFFLATALTFTLIKRWGDAPVHSIAASLFLKADQIHFFQEIGYQHDDWGHCPLPNDIWEKGQCACSQRGSFGEFFLIVFLFFGRMSSDCMDCCADYDVSSCKPRWDSFIRSRG